MSFEFLQELAEARMFRNPSKLGETPISELADDFFAAVLAIQMLKKTDPKAAQRYAEQTIQTGSINGWRSSGSDLHNMAFMLKNQERYSEKLARDRHVTLPYMTFMGWLRDTAAGREDDRKDRQFLLRLQRDLGIQSQGLKNARRTVSDWDAGTRSEHVNAATRVHRSMKGINKSDVYLPYNRMVNKKNLLITEPEKEKKSILPTLGKLAAIGAAGYYLGKKSARA